MSVRGTPLRTVPHSSVDTDDHRFAVQPCRPVGASTIGSATVAVAAAGFVDA